MSYMSLEISKSFSVYFPLNFIICNLFKVGRYLKYSMTVIFINNCTLLFTFYTKYSSIYKTPLPVQLFP